jgi:hypothetical protein
MSERISLNNKLFIIVAVLICMIVTVVLQNVVANAHVLRRKVWFCSFVIECDIIIILNIG